MLDAISAETLKLTRHKASWFLVWLYPVGVAIVFLLAIAAALMVPHRPEHETLAAWIAGTTIVWSLPANTLVRYLIAAFVAVAFAGEYGWNTWKLIVPHRSRIVLIAAKYVVVTALLAVAFLASAVLATLGSWIRDVASGDAVPAGIGAGVLLRAHGSAAVAALAPGLVTIGYASLAGVLTRSTIAALVVSLVAVSVEQILFGLTPILYLKAPGLVGILYHVLPGYHLANLDHWIRIGSPLETPLPGAGVVALRWTLSLAAVAAWIAGLVALTVASFRRQDIN
jgi:ABC-type transport system involved in multi-copper enzyme maturation permease subunit